MLVFLNDIDFGVLIKLETRNKQQNPQGFWMDPLSLCSLMKIKRVIGCLLEMSLGGMLLTLIIGFVEHKFQETHPTKMC